MVELELKTAYMLSELMILKERMSKSIIFNKSSACPFNDRLKWMFLHLLPVRVEVAGGGGGREREKQAHWPYFNIK